MEMKKQIIDEVLSHYSGEREDLLPILQDFQDLFKYVSDESIVETARFLNISKGIVCLMIEFYDQFTFNKKRNKYE